MRQAWIVIATAGMLAGCGSSTKETAAATGTVALHNATAGEVQEQVAAATGSGALFRPGHWEGTVKILDMAMPGMEKLPPAMREQMKARMSSGSSFQNCLTPQEAADARKTLAEHQEGECTYDHFTMAGGTIDAAMSCKGGGVLRRMTMTGTYSQTGYHIVSQTSGTGEGPAGVSMKVEMNAQRTGDCAPGDN